MCELVLSYKLVLLNTTSFFESLSSLTSMPFLFLVRVRVCCVLLAVAQYECVVLMIERLKIVSITAGSCVASKSDS